MVLALRIGVSKVAPRFAAPSRHLRGEEAVDVATLRRLGLADACQLQFCHLFTRCDGASACSPRGASPVEPTRPHLNSVFIVSHGLPAAAGVAPAPTLLSRLLLRRSPRAFR